MYGAGVQQEQHFGVWRWGHATVQRSRPPTPAQQACIESFSQWLSATPTVPVRTRAVPRWCEWRTWYRAVASRGRERWSPERWSRESGGGRTRRGDSRSRRRPSGGVDTQLEEEGTQSINRVHWCCHDVALLSLLFPTPSFVHRLEPSRLLSKLIHGSRFLAADIRSNV